MRHEQGREIGANVNLQTNNGQYWEQPEEIYKETMIRPRRQGDWDKEMRKQTMVKADNERQTNPT